MLMLNSTDDILKKLRRKFRYEATRCYTRYHASPNGYDRFWHEYVIYGVCASIVDKELRKLKVVR